jgi:nucleotide-binding universal stress UspA family protein
MIKDVMVHLDGTSADERRLAATSSIAILFESHVIGLFLNVLPMATPAEGDSAGAVMVTDLLEKARQAGNKTEAILVERLSRLNKPVEIRRFDVFQDTIADVAAREARSADVFLDRRPKKNGSLKTSERLVEGVLFGSGRHLFLIGDRTHVNRAFDHALVAWNGSRESSRALAESLPYLHKARAVTLVVVSDDDPIEEDALLGADAVTHLNHHGIDSKLHRAKIRNGDVSAALTAEAKRLNADLIVMGGYGHSRLREWLLGGVTYHMLHHAPVPLLIAH